MTDDEILQIAQALQAHLSHRARDLRVYEVQKAMEDVGLTRILRGSSQ